MSPSMVQSPRTRKEHLIPEWGVHVTMLILQASLGLYHVLAKVALKEGIDQLVFCIYRDLIALALLGPPAYLAERSVRTPLSPALLRWFLVLGATGVLGNQLLFLIGLNLTGPAVAAAIQPSIQIFTFVLALLLGIETVHWRRTSDWAKLIGVAVCVSGAAVLAGFKGPVVLGNSPLPPSPLGAEGSPPSAALGSIPLGVLALLGNCLCMALYLTLQVPVLEQFPAPLSVTALAYLFGAGLMVVLGLVFSSSATVWSLTPLQMIAVVYAGVVNSAIGYSLVTWANKRVGPAVVALYTPLQPVSSALLAWLILHSPIMLGSVLGGCLVLLGLYLYIWGRNAASAADMPKVRLSPSPSVSGALGREGEELEGLVLQAKQEGIYRVEETSRERKGGESGSEVALERGGGGSPAFDRLENGGQRCVQRLYCVESCCHLGLSSCNCFSWRTCRGSSS